MRLLLGEQGEEGGVSDDIAGAQAGQAPRLGQRADDEDAFEIGRDQRIRLSHNGIHEGLVDHQDTSGGTQ